MDRVFVGDIRGSTLAVRSGRDSAACGFGLETSKPIGVTASFHDGALRGGICGTVGVVELERAAHAAGVTGYRPGADSGTVGSHSGLSDDRAMFALTGVALVGAGLATSYYLARRRSSRAIEV